MFLSVGRLRIGGGLLASQEAGRTPCVSLIGLPKRSAYALPSGSLLEFPRPRSFDRGALVSSSFPSRRNEADASLLRPCSGNAKGNPSEKKISKLGRTIFYSRSWRLIALSLRAWTTFLSPS